jgi:hypothetical protein
VAEKFGANLRKPNRRVSYRKLTVVAKHEFELNCVGSEAGSHDVEQFGVALSCLSGILLESLKGSVVLLPKLRLLGGTQCNATQTKGDGGAGDLPTRHSKANLVIGKMFDFKFRPAIVPTIVGLIRCRSLRNIHNEHDTPHQGGDWHAVDAQSWQVGAHIAFKKTLQLIGGK